MRDFFFNDTATTEIYTLSLHDALPISFLIFLLTIVGYSSLDAETIMSTLQPLMPHSAFELLSQTVSEVLTIDRKSTRLNSSHANISYAVFCLKKKPSSAPATNLSPTCR